MRAAARRRRQLALVVGKANPVAKLDVLAVVQPAVRPAHHRLGARRQAARKGAQEGRQGHRWQREAGGLAVPVVWVGRRHHVSFGVLPK